MFKNKIFQFANDLEIKLLNFSSLEVFTCVDICFCSRESEPISIRVDVTRVETYDLDSATCLQSYGTQNFEGVVQRHKRGLEIIPGAAVAIV